MALPLRVTSADRAAYEAVVRHDPCAYCGARGDIQLDHIVPRARGGADDLSNLTAACRLCNATKSAYAFLALLALRANSPSLAERNAWRSLGRRVKHYRAIISVPIDAEDDNDAHVQAEMHAFRLRHRHSDTIAGYVELVIEVHEASLTAIREVYMDAGFRKQVPGWPRD